MTFALSDLVRGLVVLSVHPRQAEVAPGAAKAFGFSIPAGVLSIVDEVIESMTDVRFGTNRTWPDVRLESAFGGRAEVEFRGRQVR